MKTRKFLLGLPILVALLMLQAGFWVPSQKRGIYVNPDRLEKFLDGTIADAAILNPILNADSASSDVCDQIFEGLLDYDQDLHYRGRLAKSWSISERAYLLIPTQKNPQDFFRKIQTVVKRKDVKTLKLLPPSIETRALPPELATEKFTEAKVNLPWRIEFQLTSVEQNFFEELKKKLGEAPWEKIDTTSMIHGLPSELAAAAAPLLVPPAEHNPVIQFELRQGVKFHDGHAFSAEDVEFTFASIMNPKNLSPRTSDYEPVKSFKVIDPLHIEIVYKRLYSPAIGTWGMGILPKHLLNDQVLKEEAARRKLNPETFSMRQSTFNRKPVGTGPFRFKEWKPDQYIKLLRNDAYWEGPPHYKESVFRVLPNPLAMEMEFYAGTLDGYAPRPVQVDRLKDSPEYQHFSGLSKGYEYIGYNFRRDQFKDPRVRRALGLALDVDAIIKYIYLGHAERVTGPFLKQTPYYNTALQPLPYDPAQALELFRQAGWVKNSQGKLVNEKTSEPFRFTLITNNGNDLRKGIMTVAQDSWSKLGIECATQTVEWTVFLQKHVNPGNFDALVLGWSMGIEPDLYQIWHSSQTHPEELNFVGYNNPRADNLILKIRQEYNQEALKGYCHALHQIIYDDQPYTFLTASRWTFLLDRHIVRKLPGDQFARITSTPTGRFNYHFNQWIQLSPDAYSSVKASL